MNLNENIDAGLTSWADKAPDPKEIFFMKDFAFLELKNKFKLKKERF